MPHMQNANKTTLSLNYTTLLSLLTALLTLKFYHALARLTHDRNPRPATLHSVEQRIVSHFLRIVPEAAYRSSLGVGAADGAVDIGVHYSLHGHRDDMFARLHSSPRDPGIYHSRTGTGTDTNSNSYGHGHTNTNSYLTTSPMFHFSAFDLASNQAQPQVQAKTRETDDSSFLESLAMCAPYQRAGLRLPARPGRCTVSSNAETLSGRDLDVGLDTAVDSAVFGCASVSVSGSPTPTTTPTPKLTPSDDLRIVNAFPVRNGNGPGYSTDLVHPDPDSDSDLEAYLHEPVHLANSFPGDCPVTFGTGYGDGAGVEGLARSGSRGKPVISVRPFTDLD